MKSTKEIKKWMIDKDLTQAKIERTLGKKNYAGSVSHFINGRYASKNFCKFFINNGCPQEYFNKGRVV